MASKLPSFQFYPGDWKKDHNLSRCTHAAKGVWIDLLCTMFECEQRGVLATDGIAWTESEIVRAVGGDSDVTLLAFRELLRNGVIAVNKNGAYFSKRMVRDEELRKIRSQSGKKGGNPSLLNQKKHKEILLNQNGTTHLNHDDNQNLTTRLNQNLTPSSSSSSSSSDKEKESPATPSPAQAAGKTPRPRDAVWDWMVATCKLAPSYPNGRLGDEVARFKKNLPIAEQMAGFERWWAETQGWRNDGRGGPPSPPLINETWGQAMDWLQKQTAPPSPKAKPAEIFPSWEQVEAWLKRKLAEPKLGPAIRLLIPPDLWRKAGTEIYDRIKRNPEDRWLELAKAAYNEMVEKREAF